MEATGQGEVIREVRAIRERLAAEQGYDVRALFEAAKRRQEKSGREVVHLEPCQVSGKVAEPR